MAILGDSTAISMNVLNTVEAGTIKKRGGTSSQFLMADGSVSTHSGMDKVGTVTSVAASAGGGISVSGSPITSSGTLTITNTGVRSVTAGSTANVIKVNTNGSEANITINNVAHATSADSATTASKISTEAGTDSTNRPVFFAYSGDNTRVVYDNDFKYNPGTNTLSIGTGTLTATQYSGNAATATNATTATNLANKPSLTWSKATSASAGSTLSVTAGGKTSDAITIDKVRAAFTADSATTATNLANKPSLTWSKATSASAGSTLTVTAGGKTSDAITIDKVRAAFTADSATNATTATNLANKPSLTWSKATSASAGSTLTVTAGGKESDLITIDKVRAAFTADSATKATQDGSGNTITSTYVKKSGDTMTGSLTATSFVKSGGTASQFLMANGSVKTLSTTVSQNDSNPVSGGAVWSFCDEFEEVTATALNYLNLSKQDKLTAGSGIALTQASGSAIISVAGVPREVLSATHAGLVQLRNNNRLVPGQWYRITDYVTTTTTTDTQSAGHPFDIIVVALDTNKLSETAFAIQSVRDTDGYFSNSKLTAWQLWYCLDNDTSRFDWADTANGKGVIYRMIDEYDNDCPYDFKNIQFKRYKVTSVEGSEGDLKTSLTSAFKNSYISTRSSNCTIGDSGLTFVVNSTDFKFLYTFSVYDRGGFLDDSFIPYCRKNKMGTYYRNSKAQSLNNNVFCDPDGQDSDKFSGNTFKENCHNNTCWGYSFHSNTFEAECYNNIFGNNFSSNTLGFSFSSNTFGVTCTNNTFGNKCYNNTFGNSYYDNVFGNDCSYNTFGNDCSYNTFGNKCYNNTFGNSCYDNVFGNDCYRNTFGSYCYGNTFGNKCIYIKFTSSSSSNATIYNYYRNNHFGDGCQYILFAGTATASSNALVQNYNFAQGINTVNSSTTPGYKSVAGVRSRLYQTYVVTNTSNVVTQITISGTSVTVS